MTIDEVVGKAADIVLTQTNAVGAILGIGCYWLAGQWTKERIAHHATIGKLFDLAERQNDSNSATTEALVALKTRIEASPK